MGIPVPRGNSVVEDGAYPGVVAKVYDVGNHVTEYEGHKEIKHQVCIAVELDGHVAGYTGENGDRQHVLWDKLNVPMFWPGKRNSNLWSYAEAALSEKGAVEMTDFCQIEGAGVSVTVKNVNGRTYIRQIAKLMRGIETPTPLGDYQEPWGLAKYLIEHALPDEEVARLKEEWAAEADRKRAEEEASSFSAPTPGADDIPPEGPEDEVPF